MGFVIAHDGQVPEEASSAHPLGLNCMGFKDKQEFKILRSFNPAWPQRGPYEASEGNLPG